MEGLGHVAEEGQGVNQKRRAAIMISMWSANERRIRQSLTGKDASFHGVDGRTTDEGAPHQGKADGGAVHSQFQVVNKDGAEYSVQDISDEHDRDEGTDDTNDLGAKTGQH